jgi:predicted RNA binding protein YcfA (HicA-like mRNA interferase family)
MSGWRSCKAKRVLAALLRIGWQVKRRSGPYRTLSRDGWPGFVLAFRDREEIRPRMLAHIAEHTSPNCKMLIIYGSHIPTAVRAEPAEA